MITINFIAIYPEMGSIAKQVFEEQNRLEEYRNTKSVCNLQVITVESSSTDYVLQKVTKGDVIITRGGIAYDLKKHGFEFPIVELLITGSDLLHALMKAKSRYGNSKTAIVGSSNMLIGIETLSKAINFPVTQYHLSENTVAEVKYNIDLAKQEGNRVIIGGTNGSKYAESLGLKGILIESGRESIYQSLLEARRIAKVSQLERQKSLMYRTIIDSAYEGVIVVDREFKVLVLNSAAQKTLGLSPIDYVGKQVENIFSYPTLSKIIKNHDKFENEIVQLDNQHLSATKIPLILNEEQFGTVLAFQDVTRIQEMESKIRGKIFSRGHTAKYHFSDIIGTSAIIKDTIRAAKLYAQNDSNILIYGETGTGKELFAQSIHNFSIRSREPFVAINCAALPESLLESELFGYAEGAFTGASKKGKKGLFELAHNGTLFLDEISELSIPLQGKLLRVIQEQEVRRIGHDRIIPVNVRIISTCNKNLLELIRQEKFREDLYYRLNVFMLQIPPLREREDDILHITNNFISNFYQSYGENIHSLSDEEARYFNTYSWPGNIRELRNICERFVALRNNHMTNIENICGHIFCNVDYYKKSDNSSELSALSIEEVRSEVQHKEANLIISSLKKNNFNKTKTAEALGISRVTLWRRMRAAGLADK